MSTGERVQKRGRKLALTDDDIRALFCMNGSEVQWREISVVGLNALFRRAAAKHNARAGSPVEFWSGFMGQLMVTAAGEQVTRRRIETVLLTGGKKPSPKVAAAKRPMTKAAIRNETPEQREERMRLMVAEGHRNNYIRAALGFQRINVGAEMGTWLDADGKKWSDAMLKRPEAVAAGEQYDAMEAVDE